jgi:hypothetical protein
MLAAERFSWLAFSEISFTASLFITRNAFTGVPIRVRAIIKTLFFYADIAYIGLFYWILK